MTLHELGLSAHDHGNCELCDAIEAEVFRLTEELAHWKGAGIHAAAVELSALEDENTRLTEANGDLTERLAAERRRFSDEFFLACNRADVAVLKSEVLRLTEALRQAEQERDKWLGNFNRSEQFQNGPTKRAEAAEAEVERLVLSFEAVTAEWKRVVDERKQADASRARLIALLKRYLDNHCANADAEGMSALCECKLCLDARAALAAEGETPDALPRCPAYRPDHNGECLNCDEPADMHDDEPHD